MRKLLLAMILLLPLAACAAGDGAPSVKLKSHSFAVEIADDLQEQAQGLMFRRELAADRGMLFVYERAQPLSFWMKNCYIALDILFFDAQARFINGHYAVPPCQRDPCPLYPATRDSRYVLELAAGVGKALKLAPGDELTLPSAAR
jgi:hypothetical protein